MSPEFYTPQEVSQKLRLSVHTVYEYIRMGKLQAVRFGNRYRITEDDVELFVEYQKKITQEGFQ